MAATNYTPIQLYHSTTASAVPVNTNLVNGELAINITDGKLYYKDNGGTVQVIASKGTGTIGGSTTQVQYNLSGALAGSSNFTFNGTTATINTLNLTNALGATYGGTAQSSWTTGDLLYASGSNTLAKLGIGLNTYILTSNGTIPGWAAPSAISVNTATNLAGGAAGSVPYQSGAGATTFLSIGTANQVVTSTGSAPQWSSGLSITTLTASDAVTFSATTQNIALGTSQTSGTFTVGGTAQTGNISIDRSTKTHTLNIGTGITESGQTKTINIGTAGDTGSTTAITIGSANGTTITVNGTVNASTLDLTNLEVTNIKAKDGTASMTLADTTGNVTVSSAFAANGGVTIGDASGDAFTINSSAVSTPNGLNFDSNTLVIDAANNRVGVGTSSPQSKFVVSNAGAEGIEFIPAESSRSSKILAYSRTASGRDDLIFDAYEIKFQTNVGTERARITATGQVNIGGNFTSTNNTLQVTGNAAIGDTLAGPTDGLYVKGSVGIGTNSPGAPLSFASAIGQKIRFYNALTGYGIGVESSEFRFVTDNSAVFTWGVGTYASPAERMRLDSSGTLILRQSSNAANTSVSFNTTVQNALTLGSDGNLAVGESSTANARLFSYISSNSVPSMVVRQDGTAAIQTWQGSGGGEKVRITSGGNVGIGETNPTRKLQVASGAAADTGYFDSTATPAYTATAYNGGNARISMIGGNASGATTGIRFSQGGSFEAYFGGVQESGGAAAFVWQGYSGAAYAERMRLDSSGNLGLGVTPSAWGAGYRAIDVLSFGASIASTGSGATTTNFSHGTYFNGTNWVQKEADVTGARYQQTGSSAGSSHQWFVAPNSTAGGTIAFSQAMTLSASAELNIDSGTGGGRLTFQPGATQNQILSTTTSFGAYNILRYVAAQHQWLDAASTQAMTLDASGNLLVGTTSTSGLITGQLQLGTTSAATAGIQILNSTTGVGGIYFGDSTTGNARFRGMVEYNHTADALVLSTAETERARITSGGDFRVKGAGTAGSTDAFQISGSAPADAARLTSGGDFGVGTTSPGGKIACAVASSGTFQNAFVATNGVDSEFIARIKTNVTEIANGGSSGVIAFATGGSYTERARITSVGDFIVGGTTNGKLVVIPDNGTAGAAQVEVGHANGTASGAGYMVFTYNGGIIGSITQNGTTGVLYNITSDYRLKDVVGAVTGAGARIDALKPVDYTWKADGSTARGFLAHEFQAVYPGSVTGTKDAVDEEGKPVYQNMQASTSEVIADLVAELQSLRARVAQLEAK